MKCLVLTEPCMWLPDQFTFCWCTEWTHSDVWSPLATTPQCSFTIGYRQSQKKWQNCYRRAIWNATNHFGAGHGVVCHRGGSDGSGGARPLWRSHSAWTEMFFADVVIKKIVNKNARKAAKTMWMMDCAKLNDCILQIQPWQNGRQQSVNDFWSCVLGNHTSDRL